MFRRFPLQLLATHSHDNFYCDARNPPLGPVMRGWGADSPAAAFFTTI